MEDELKRYIAWLKRFGVISGIVILVLVLGIVSWGSILIAQVSKQSTDNQNRIAEIGKVIAEYKPVNAQDLAKEVAIIIGKPKDGAQGPQGENGTDSISTHTEKETIVYQSKPGIDGTNGKTPQLGQLPSGKIVWKYNDDRQWQEIPVVNVLTDKLPNIPLLLGDRDG